MVFSKIQNSAKLVYVMITENISSNLRRAVRSAVTNGFNTAQNMSSFLILAAFFACLRLV